MAGLLALAGCGTVTPKAVKPAQASFDAGTQNSGFRGFTNAPTPHSGVFAASAIERYNLLAQRFGNDPRFVPPVTPWQNVEVVLAGKTETNYILSAQGIINFWLLSEIQRSK